MNGPFQFICLIEYNNSMKKIKTVRSAAKRFKRTALGSMRHKRANLRHILTKKSAKRKCRLRQQSIVSKGDMNVVLNCLPYA